MENRVSLIKKNHNHRFLFNWVLKERLAIGNYPKNKNDFLSLKSYGIKSILNLCDKLDEYRLEDLSGKFKLSFFSLPDHKSGKLPNINEIENAVSILDELIKKHYPVFVHCYAGAERSPLVCIAWLMKNRGLKTIDALEYLNENHEACSPLPEQLNILNKLKP